MPETEQKGCEAIARMVEEARTANGGDAHAAIRKIAQSLAPSSPLTLRELWADGFGLSAVGSVYWEALRSRQATLTGGTPAKPELPPNWGSARQESWEMVRDPMEALIAVRGLGVYRHGEMTAPLWSRWAADQRAPALTMLRDADAAEALASRLSTDETTEQAARRGALTEDDWAFLNERTKRVAA